MKHAWKAAPKLRNAVQFCFPQSVPARPELNDIEQSKPRTKRLVVSTNMVVWEICFHLFRLLCSLGGENSLQLGRAGAAGTLNNNNKIIQTVYPSHSHNCDSHSAKWSWFLIYIPNRKSHANVSRMDEWGRHIVFFCLFKLFATALAGIRTRNHKTHCFGGKGRVEVWNFRESYTADTRKLRHTEFCVPGVMTVATHRLFEEHS